MYTIDDFYFDEIENKNESALLPSKPTYEFNTASSGDGGGGIILSLKVQEELNIIIVTTSSGSVEFFNMDEVEEAMINDSCHDCRRRSFYPSFDSGRKSSNVFPLCATIVEENKDDNDDDIESQHVGFLAASQGFKILTPSLSSSSSSSKKKRKFSIACGGGGGSTFYSGCVY